MISASIVICAARPPPPILNGTMTAATPTFTSSRRRPMRKVSAKRRWKAAQSKRLATTGTAPRRQRSSTAESMAKQLSRRPGSAVAVPIAFTIAGSDCSAGAGLQADLKTFAALGVYGLTAVTCVVAEVPRKVSRIEPVSVKMVREQIEVLLKNFRVSAIKTGLLCSADIVSAVVQAIQDTG